MTSASAAGSAEFERLRKALADRYRLEDAVGAGGMATVFVAQDLRHGRKVAVKVFRPEHQESLGAERFLREIRVTANLEHPRILTLIDSGATEGFLWYVVPYVRGESLREKLRHDKQLPLDEALGVARDVGAALAFAHERGVIHRDVKPENILLFEGQAMLADFGLAVALKDAGDARLTATGVSLGTPQYMSPEQAAGESDLDARADVYSLGAVLYEMLTGEAPHTGPNIQAIIARILSQTPTEVRVLRPAVPAHVAAAVMKALATQRVDRFSGVQAFVVALEQGVGVPRASWRSRWRWPATIGSAVALTAIAVAAWPRSAPPITHFTPLTSSRLLFSPAWSPLPMVSDGSRIYFTEFRNFIFHPIQIMRQGGESRPLVGLDTGQQYQIGAITRDGSYLVLNPFFGIGGGMWLAPTMGGALRRFGQVEGNAVGFSRDGKTVVYSNGVLTSDIFVANADGSAPRKLLTAPGRFYWPEFSPDDRRIRLTSFDYGKTGLPTLWEMSADGTGLHPLLPGWTDAPSQCCGSWTADGKYYVFQATREGSTHLWALREGRSLFSSAAPKPRQLTSGPMNFIRPLVPPDGKGLYAVGWQLRGELAQFDAASGNFIPHPASVSAEWLAYSRDGQRMAYATYPEAQLWRSKPDGSDRLQLTLPPMRARDPQWSPDGSTIAFEGQVGDKPWKLYVVSSDGGAARALTNEDRLEAFPTWSRDGSQLAFAVVSDAATLFPSQGLRILDMRTRSETEVPQSGGFLAPAWAPDGRSIAAVTGDRKRIMLYDVANRRWTELARPGVDVLGEYWSADGLSLHFHSMPNRIQFFRFDMRKRQLRRLGEIHDRWVFGAGLPWMGVTPEGIPVFLREQSIHQLFALDWER